MRPTSSTFVVRSLALSCLLYLPGAAAQAPTCFPEQAVLLPQAGSSRFYADCAGLSGDVAVAGDWDEDVPGLYGGTVSVYERSEGTWSFTTRLYADDAVEGDRFGFEVAVDGDTIVVGAPHNEAGLGPGTGAVYVFERSGATWSQTAKLVGDDAAPGDVFGAQLALEGDTLLVGSTGHDGVYSSAGAVYAFVRSGGNWIQEQRIELADQLPHDFFGAAIALDGDTAIVGATGHDQLASNAGAAFVFTRSGGSWTRQQKLLPTTTEYVYGFGGRIALDGQRALIRGDGVYVFELVGDFWSQVGRLETGEEVEFGYGSDLVLVGDVAYVGDSNNDTQGHAAGAIHVFERQADAWARVHVILPAAPVPATLQFGSRLVLDGETLITTAPRSNVVGDGFVYVLSVVHSSAVASVGHRNGGTNADFFRVMPANLGETLSFTTWPVETGHTQALVIGFDSPVELTLSGGQTLLCLDLFGGGELINTGFHAGSMVQIDLHVPVLPHLAGFEVHTQALHAFGTTPFALSNAQDIVIGACP